MKQLINNLKGDKGIWSFVALLALFSFMPVFSASSNLAYLGHGNGNTLGYLVKHFAHICIGFALFIGFIKFLIIILGLFLLGLPVVWFFLAYTLIKGTVIAGANASSWIKVPFIGITFQTSTLASLVLFIFVARYLSKKREEPITFKNSFWELWLPVFITLIFILPANFSTAALIFSMIFMLVFIGKYPLKYIGVIVGLEYSFLLFLFFFPKLFQIPIFQ